MRKHLLPLLLCLPLLTSAQTYFYINSITVDPAQPTTNDVITITVHGDLSSTGAYIVSSSATVIGNSVELNIVAADPGGFTVLVPHEVDFTVGPLPANNYTIVMSTTSVGVWDLAQLPDHLFTVSGNTAVAEATRGDALITIQGEQLTIDATDGAPLGAIEIVDASGKVVVRTQSTAAHYRTELATVVPGVYVLRLGGRGVTRRFVVQ